MDFPDKPVAQLLGATGPIHAVCYSASPGTYILAGSGDRSIRLYNPAPSTNGSSSSNNTSTTATAPPPSTYSGHIGGTTTTTAAEPAIPQGRLIQTYSAHGYEVLALAVASDNARFASAGGDRTVFLWDVATATTLRRFAGHEAGRVHGVAFGGADDALVVSGGGDTTVRVWDCRSTSSSKAVQVLTGARDAVSAVAVPEGPGSSEIVAASVDGRVRSYDVRMGRVTTDVIGGAGVTGLCLARDARSVLVSALDSKLRLMDRERGTCLRTYADPRWRNEELRVQAVLGGKERWVVAGDELTADAEDRDSNDGGHNNGYHNTSNNGGAGGGGNATTTGSVWAWDLLSGKLVAKVPVPWGPAGSNGPKRVVGRDGREKERKNVVSCIAWKAGGFGDQFCVGGTSGVATVFGR